MRQTVLRQLYDEALDGLPGLGTPEEAAQRHLTSSRHEASEALVQRYALLSGATGFVCGLPGYVSMPVTIPANLAGVALLQLHLCAATAVLAGRLPQDEAVRRRCISCVIGSVLPDDARTSDEDEEAEEREGLLRRLVGKVGERGVRFASEQAVRLASRGARSLPLVGGAVSGIADARSTQMVGQRARRAFLDKPAR